MVLFTLFSSIFTSLLGTSVWAANECTATWGLLDIAPVEQKADVWCWAASASAVLNFHQVFDPQSTSEPPLYTQCRLFNIAKNPGIDCCAIISPTDVDDCNKTGWPDEIFDRLNPPIPYIPSGPLSWEQARGQICPGEVPFIFAATPPEGIPHTYVVKGFNENYDGTGQRGIFVDSHNGDDGPGFVDFDCSYLAQNGSCGNWTFWHEGDYYDIRPSVDTTPPSPPRNLRVQ